MTPEEFAELIGEVQDSVAVILKERLPKAKVFNRWVQDKDRDLWAEEFRSDDDKDENDERRIHAVTVAWAGSQLPELAGQSLQAIGPVVTFAIDIWHQYDMGSDNSNSERIVRTEMLLAQLKLWKESDLRFREVVLGHQQLQFPPDLDVVPLGGNLVHNAPGVFTVLMQSVVIS